MISRKYRLMGMVVGVAAISCIMVGCTSANEDLWLNGEVLLEGEPAYEYRILNHWDNLDDSVERGYAGKSIWEWTSAEVPTDRIEKYAALNEKIGINGIVLNNVNASPKILDDEHLERIATIAEILRGHGIKTYLSINFASPMSLGGLSTADPLSQEVIDWWASKVDNIYAKVPDFGGFLVKASSEGQPGPQDFGRSHADGANMLADILKPHDGIVMWRAFVYSAGGEDRAKQAYNEFMPLDGKFRDNVVLQVKNGPVDFQPREPFSPLFGSMKSTPVAPELQITQEYTGQSRNLVYLGPMWEECLDADTYSAGVGSTVAKNTSEAPLSVIAGVANIGQDANWCGSIFAQANWFAFGKLAWNPELTAEEIADEWLRLTFPKPKLMSQKKFTKNFIEPVKEMMMESREVCVNYMMPMGLHHLFAWEHHYGPDPGLEIEGARPDWMPSYYHQADSLGIGFDRTRTGSDAVDQYNEPLASLYNDTATCPQEYLLWFHHLPWNYVIESPLDESIPDFPGKIDCKGKTVWDAIEAHYNYGVEQAERFRDLWKGMKRYVDADRYASVASTLDIMVTDARLWRDTCLNYFKNQKR